MSNQASSVSGYCIMWVWVLFDLPVGTKAERKAATKFRKDLQDLGFRMVQFSVYLRHAWSREKAESFSSMVEQCIPESGHVQILFFTDKQYAMSKVYSGPKKNTRQASKPQKYLLL